MEPRLTVVSEDELLLGSVVAERYHVREVLGQGSTGTVFGAEHLHFARRAAMKVVRSRHVPAATVQRVFDGEARAAWTIAHPCLCEVFDIGTLPDGAPFYVAERLYGEPLARRLGRERFSTAAAVDLLMQLLSALDAIHSREQVLRDLRPQSLFLVHRRGCRPLLKVLDFGLGRLVPVEAIASEWDAIHADGSAASSSTGPSGLGAVPFYLSPERVRGGADAIEPASDLFAAAVVFYEALAGEKPFAAPTFQGILQRILQGSPTSLTRHRPDVPPDVDAAVMRALSTNPRHRPASAREMQDELRAAFEGNRRGSSSQRAAPITVAPPAAASSSAGLLAVVGSAPKPTGELEDETRTDQRRSELLAAAAEIAIDVEIDFAPPPAREREREREDEETETMKLTPELRARIDQMTDAARAPAEAELDDVTRPPPTRRMDKPRG